MNEEEENLSEEFKNTVLNISEEVYDFTLDKIELKYQDVSGRFKASCMISIMSTLLLQVILLPFLSGKMPASEAHMLLKDIISGIRVKGDNFIKKINLEKNENG